MSEKREIKVNVPVLARVEGEGALEFTANDGQIESIKLHIYEPPRLFEKFLEGRSYLEIPDIVARICGICPVAYQMSAVQAIEAAFEAEVSEWTQHMRRLMYCGEWIQSHALHIHLLAAPDFLGFQNVNEMAKLYPEEVRRGLRLQRFGNKIIALLGARSVHPVGVCAGGFHRAPTLQEIADLAMETQQAHSDAESLLDWVLGLSLPQEAQFFTSVAMCSETEYPMCHGKIHSSLGLRITKEEYTRHFNEFQVPHSTALHSHLDSAPYLVGPLARINLNPNQLPAKIVNKLKQSSIELPSSNMFHSVIARAIEILIALEVAQEILSSYMVPDASKVDVLPRKSTGIGCSEAPRGMLWHRYKFDDSGIVLDATIIPPTSQNQARIEEDLKASLQHFGLNKTDDELRLHSEMVIRNYDPCISCSTHFLKVKINRV